MKAGDEVKIVNPFIRHFHPKGATYKLYALPGMSEYDELFPLTDDPLNPKGCLIEYTEETKSFLGKTAHHPYSWVEQDWIEKV